LLTLQKWQRNLIVETIQAVGLDPRQFDLEDNDSQVRIKHKWSPSCFSIRSAGASYDVTYVVGDGAEWPASAYSWQTIPGRIRIWLVDVKRDLETPDLWAELQREARLLDVTSDDATENTPFTPDEQSEILARLQALGGDVRRTYSLSAEQIRALDVRLDYLANAARRLGRKDWLNVCAGAVLGYILTASLPPEAARDLFLGLLRTIGHLCGLPDSPMLTGL
jgi:hypothetical protein